MTEQSMGCGLSDEVTLDVDELSPGLRDAIFAEVSEMAAIRGAETQQDCRAAGGIVRKASNLDSEEAQSRGFACALPREYESNIVQPVLPGLGQFIPRKPEPVLLGAGLAVGAVTTAMGVRLIAEETGVQPVFLTTGATAIALLTHLGVGSNFTLGLFAGTVPLLLEQGAVALMDMLFPAGPALSGAEGSGVPIMEGTTGKQIGQLSRRDLDEIKRVTNMLQPGNRGGSAHQSAHRTPAMSGGGLDSTFFPVIAA